MLDVSSLTPQPSKRHWARRLLGVFLLSCMIVYFGFIGAVLGLRYVVLPDIERWRPEIERQASLALGQSVQIGRIEASWDGLNPDLGLFDVRVTDADGRPAVAFSQVDAVLSWWSVPRGALRLHLLRITGPTLNLRRDAQGHFFIAGIPLSSEQDGPGFPDWLLAQRRLRIQGATLIWEDALRGAPPLVLNDLALALDNERGHHRFGLTAQPPAALASKIDLRGDFSGKSVADIKQWSGQAYSRIDYADLAVWQQWIDYPITLPRGEGAMRLWLSIGKGQLRAITADTALKNVSLRLASHLPLLELAQLNGRLAAHFSGNDAIVDGYGFELSTEAKAEPQSTLPNAVTKISVAPTDFHLAWQTSATGALNSGAVKINRFDSAALANLAEYLPLDAQVQKWLKDFAPHGQISALDAQWKGDADHVQSYSFKAGFDDFSLRAKGSVPGFSGFSGKVDANEKIGHATLQTKKSTLNLPAIFPEPLIELNSLHAQAEWKKELGEWVIRIPKLEFSGAEATGVAQGSYRLKGEGLDEIDLTASLSRGEATAVWRYMPHAVGIDAHRWLHSALLAGSASAAHLTLKGKLADFPFVDKKTGQFLVTVKAQNVVLDYGKGWPRIEKLDGDLRFEGKGMQIDASRGSILGTRLGKTRVEIADFDLPIPLLTVKGEVDGPTSEFLKFIDKSPVAERIERFTEDMRASGNGHLDLDLQIPLDEAKLDEAKIEGRYRLSNNDVIVDPALPHLKQLSGQVEFSGRDLKIPEITATLLGGPLKLKGGLQDDGRVRLALDGKIDIAQLRKLTDLPLLDRVSGSTSYRGEVRANKKSADLVIDSSLQGIASSLPEPFNKSANETLALHLEKKELPESSFTAASNSIPGPKTANPTMLDSTRITLGNAISMQIVRRQRGDALSIERGALAIGRPLVLPKSGMALGVTAKQIDIDAWQSLLGTLADKSTPQNISVNSVSLKTPDLLMLGQHYSNVDLSASLSGERWSANLSSTQASGNLQWETGGRGKLNARFKQLLIEPLEPTLEQDASDPLKELPALDVIAEDFSFGKRHFGRLELQASNVGGTWQLNKINTSNPYGTFSGSGTWQAGGGKSRTLLAFKLESSDVGRLLERLDHAGTIRGGVATFEGNVGWNGPPTSFNYASLSGDLKLDASKGQFVQISPGAGKLLGLISLQSLPRRITLDFKDVFSEGFSFDSASSQLEIRQGLMRTDHLQIDGPAARVLMSGEVDLMRETQRLNVQVQPELGGTAALGIALINPIAGVATWVAHQAFQNPLNHIFESNYLVTGTWEDPKVEKVPSASLLPVATPSDAAKTPDTATKEKHAPSRPASPSRRR